METFGLELHPDKTRLIEFGRFAARTRQQRGQGKPETFDFQVHPLLWRNAQEGVQGGPHHDRETDASDPSKDQGGTA
jgi:hypothetical protein